LKDEIFHIKGFSTDGLKGLSVIEAHMETLGTAIAMRDYTSEFFGNGATESGVLEHPESMSDVAYSRLRDSFAEREKWRPLILEENMKWKGNAISPEAMQLIDSRRFQGVEEVARAFRVPLHLIQEQTKSTSYGSGIEELNIGFGTHTIRHWNVRIERAANIQLFEPRQHGKYFMKFNIDALMRGNIKSQTEYMEKAVMWGWLSRNEARKLKDMNSLEGLDDILQPMNMMVVGEERPTTSGSVSPGTDPESDGTADDRSSDDPIEELLLPLTSGSDQSNNTPSNSEAESDGVYSREIFRPILEDTLTWLEERDFGGEKLEKLFVKRMLPVMGAMRYNNTDIDAYAKFFIENGASKTIKELLHAED